MSAVDVARAAYAELCSNLGTDPIAEENALLSIGREFLPPCALAVLDADQGDKASAATAEYFEWLTKQTRAAQDAHEREVAAGHEWHVDRRFVPRDEEVGDCLSLATHRRTRNNER